MHVTIKDIYRNIVKTQTKIEMGMTLYACCSLRDKICLYLETECKLSWNDYIDVCPFCRLSGVISQLRNKTHECGWCSYCPFQSIIYGTFMDCEDYKPNKAQVDAGKVMKLKASDTRIDLHRWWTKTFHEFEWLAEELQTLLQEK